MRTSTVSPKTNYTAYLVFKLRSRALGFDHPPPEASVGITEGEFHKQTVFMELDQLAVEPLQQDEIEPPQQKHKASCQKQRKDGWLEIELGEFFNEEGEDELQISLMEVSRIVKGGLIVEGITGGSNV
ncbi:F-box protein At2g02240-like [Fagus crenata]